MRVKATVEYLLFVVCVVLLPIIPAPKLRPVIFLIVAVAAVAPYFIRCETCKSRMNSRALGDQNLLAPVDASGRSPGPSSIRFLFAARCPYCGMPRI